MSTFQLYTIVAFSLLATGMHALITRENLLRKIMALNVMGSGIFLFLVALAYRGDGEAPDPLPHAMVLTGIVVAVSLTAFALALLRRYHEITGHAALVDDEGLE
jgi:multicomponent Na+:H+ antiporter subunit C